MKLFRKENIYILLFVLAGLLTAGFAARLCADYLVHYQYGSAPFYLYVGERFIEFMLLAIGCFIGGIVTRKKYRNK